VIRRTLSKAGIRLRFRLGASRTGDRAGYRCKLPFRRNWVAIAVLAAFDAVFLFPAITTFAQVLAAWSRPDDLFNLVAALFLTFWLVGWSIAPLVMSAILALMIFGREELSASPGTVELFIGLPFAGLGMRFEAQRMRNLRRVVPPPKSGKAWRGPHITFDYGSNSGEFGSNVTERQLLAIRSGIESASGVRIRQGDASAAELDAEREPNRVAEKAPVAPAATVGGRSEFTLASPSVLALIAANLVPIAGTLLWGWDLAHVMVLYWAESAVIGLFNLAKIAVISRWMALLAGPFFISHFGAFMAVHFLFLYALFIEGPRGFESGHQLADVAQLFIALWPALAVLFLSHAYSFFSNFLGRAEYRGRTLGGQMSEPYSRIVFMHLVLIFGGGLTLVLGEPAPVLLIVIVLKIAADVRAHLRQRAVGRGDRKE
jgi:hypothetical protein